MSGSSSDLPLILWDPHAVQAEQDCACAEAEPGPAILWSPAVDVGEDDCACADVPASLMSPGPVAAWGLWHAIQEQRLFGLSDNHTAVFNPLGPVGLAVLNGPALEVLTAYRRPQPLTTAASKQLASLGFLRPVDSPPTPVLTQPRTLTAWLHVTNACNLRCTYCYVTKTDEAMDEATGLAALDAIVRSATQNGFQAIKLKYAGGEATLNFRLVRLLHEYAQSQAAAHGLGLREVVLSNGVGISAAMLDFIRDAGIHLMISLDGLDAGHDAQRVFRNGRGSAHLAARSVDRAIAHGVKPHLSVTVTKHNADSIAAVVAFALERELPFNLNFYRDHDSSASHEELAAEDARLIAGVRAAFRVIEQRLPRQSLIAALVDRSNFAAPHDRPCGAGHSYLVVDHRGRIARCQMEIERSVTDVMAHDPLEVIRLQPAGFQNVAVDEKEGCRECAWRYWCAGGCPLLTYRVIGRSDVKSPYCNVYQALFPELVRLEGLRLLRWAPMPTQ